METCHRLARNNAASSRSGLVALLESPEHSALWCHVRCNEDTPAEPAGPARRTAAVCVNVCVNDGFPERRGPVASRGTWTVEEVSKAASNHLFGLKQMPETARKKQTCRAEQQALPPKAPRAAWRALRCLLSQDTTNKQNITIRLGAVSMRNCDRHQCLCSALSEVAMRSTSMPLREWIPRYTALYS